MTRRGGPTGCGRGSVRTDSTLLRVTLLTVLLTVEDWRRVLARPVPPGQGLRFVGVDAGANLSWSAATFAWADGSDRGASR